MESPILNMQTRKTMDDIRTATALQALEEVRAWVRVNRKNALFEGNDYAKAYADGHRDATREIGEILQDYGII